MAKEIVRLKVFGDVVTVATGKGQYPVDADGTIEVPQDEVAGFLDAGFTVFVPPGAPLKGKDAKNG